MKNIILPIHALRGLLFGESGDETVPTNPPQSGGIGDLAKIKVINYYVGQALKAVDDNEEHFHVELFTSSESQSEWAEVWLTNEWKESNARRQKFKETNQIENHERNRKQELAAKIVAAMEGKLQPTFAQLFAHQVVDQYKKHDFSGVLKKLKIWEILEEYEKENAKPN